LFQYLSTAGPRQLFTISVIADVAGEILLPHMQHFFPIFHAALTVSRHLKILKNLRSEWFCLLVQNSNDVESAFYSVLSLKHLLIHFGSDEAKTFSPLIPLIIDVVKHLVSFQFFRLETEGLKYLFLLFLKVANDEDKACQVFDIFEELFETEIPIVGPYIESIFELSLSIGANEGVPESLRVMAISWLGR